MMSDCPRAEREVKTRQIFALIVIAFYIAFQQIEGYLIAPRLMRRAVKLHPMVIILGVYVGALSFGMLGAILAAPAIASVNEIVKYLYLKVSGLPVGTGVPADLHPFGGWRTRIASHRAKKGQTSARNDVPFEQEHQEASAEDRPGGSTTI